MTSQRHYKADSQPLADSVFSWRKSFLLFHVYVISFTQLTREMTQQNIFFPFLYFLSWAIKWTPTSHFKYLLTWPFSASTLGWSEECGRSSMPGQGFVPFIVFLNSYFSIQPFFWLSKPQVPANQHHPLFVHFHHTDWQLGPFTTILLAPPHFFFFLLPGYSICSLAILSACCRY